MASLLEWAKSLHSAISELFTAPPEAKYFHQSPDTLIPSKIPNIERLSDDLTRSDLLDILKTASKEEKLLKINQNNATLLFLNVKDLFQLSYLKSVKDVKTKFNVEDFQALAGSFLLAVLNNNEELLEDAKVSLNKLSKNERLKTLSRARPKTGLSLLHLSLIFHEKGGLLPKLFEMNEFKSLVDNTRNKFGIGALSVAALLRREPAILEILIANGAKLSLTDASGKNVLFDFLYNFENDESIVQLFRYLTQRSSNEEFTKLLFQRDVAGFNFLDMSCNINAPGLFALLQFYLSDTPENELAKQTMIFRACDAGNLALLKSLAVDDKELVHHTDMNSLTLLHYAAYDGNTEMIKFLLENGADCLKLTDENVSALYFSAISGDVTCVRTIVEKVEELYSLEDSTPEKQKEIEFMFATSLVEAIRKKSDIVVKFLILKCFELGIPSDVAIAFALKDDSLSSETLRFLLETLESVESYKIEDDNILVFAAKRRNLSLVTTLVKTWKFPKEILEDSHVREFMNQVELPQDTPQEVANLVTKCVICLEENSATKFMPCAHIQCCKLCAHKLVRSDGRCPSCRKEIEFVIDV